MLINHKNIKNVIQESSLYEASQPTFEERDGDQNLILKKIFAHSALGITAVWIIFLIVLAFCQSFCNKSIHGLSSLEFNVVFSTTTGSVLVLWYIVGKYLFNIKK